MPDLLESSEEARLIQENYERFILYSKDVWGESAAGGFAKRKLPIDTKEMISSSPQKDNVMKAKQSSSTIKSLNKIKLNTMTNGITSGIYENIDSVLASDSN